MPPSPTYNESDPYKVTWIKTKTDKKIPAYWIKQNSRHGNATDIGGMIHFLAKIYEHLGVNVLHYDYIGYGLVKETYGLPNEDTTYESIEAAHQFLLDQGIQNKDIIVFGTSVGSGPTCHLASKEQGLLGVVLECPFVSCIRVVTNNILLRPFDMFVNLNKVGKFTAPTFIMHGSVDEVINQEHGKELYENLPKSYQYTPCWIDGANHHDIIDILGLDTYMKNLTEFIKYCQQFHQGKKLNEDKHLSISFKENVDTKYDKDKPSTTIQVQLLDGKKVKGHFNLTQTVGDLYLWVGETCGLKDKEFILSQSVQSISTTFTSSGSFSHQPLDDFTKTIKEVEIQNSSLIQKKK